mmetsp:Transcript_17252/g.47854  ORF Transcript_17252/g.47854 Transcript_17252/m.47854 type:complete len:202 (-) Transcript_17252:715-1320(-)
MEWMLQHPALLNQKECLNSTRLTSTTWGAHTPRTGPPPRSHRSPHRGLPGPQRLWPALKRGAKGHVRSVGPHSSSAARCPCTTAMTHGTRGACGLCWSRRIKPKRWPFVLPFLLPAMRLRPWPPIPKSCTCSTRAPSTCPTLSCWMDSSGKRTSQRQPQQRGRHLIPETARCHSSIHTSKRAPITEGVTEASIRGVLLTAG